MRFILATLAMLATLAFVGCNTTKGAMADVSAVVKTGVGVITYDPTNGATLAPGTQPVQLFGPIKTYTLEK